MEEDNSLTHHLPSSQSQTLHNRSQKKRSGLSFKGVQVRANIQKRQHFASVSSGEMKKKLMPPLPLSSESSNGGLLENASFMKWRVEDVFGLIRFHPIPCIFAASLLFFMAVEYTLRMVPSSSPPLDLGFVLTLPLHRLLASSPNLNSFLAGLNTVFVGMQTAYILWTWLIEGRPRATISALFMFTCRGILGYVTQLPVPEDFLGSGVDFPVGNVSFFLFYSGHVAASVIASLDMKRVQRWELAWTFDALNFLQAVRLLSTRGHYTIDLVVGVGAGLLFDSMAGKYLESKKKEKEVAPTTTSTCGAFYTYIK